MSHKPQTHAADIFCRDLLGKYPEMLKIADVFYRDRANTAKDCPAWCALPTGYIVTAVAGTDDEQILKKVLELTIIHELVAALIWTRNKMVYRFDGTLADTLAAQRLDGGIPSEIFDCLPYPCVYIERNMAIEGHETTGFFAWLDWGVKDNTRLLRLLFPQPNNKSIPFVLPISGGTINDGILELFNNYAISAGRKNYTAKDMRNSPMVQSFIGCINILLYLCSEKPDMPDDTKLRARRSRDTYGNPKRAVAWEVGTRIGAALRKAIKSEAENEALPDNGAVNGSEAENDSATTIGNEAKTDKPPHSSPRPHLRRAHWHSFWTGKRDGAERKLILRWLPPMAVNIDEAELPTVITPVKD